MKRDEYVLSIKLAFVSLSTQFSMTWLISFLPFLSIPFFRKIAEGALNALFNHLANKTEMGVFFLYIDTRVALESDDFEEKAYKNFKAQRYGTSDEKIKAEKELWDSFYRFAKISGAN